MISAYEKLGGFVWIPRMLRKIRLRAAGKLPDGFQDNMGKGFDGRCVRFLGVSYDEVVERVVAGASDQDVVTWILEKGTKHTDEGIAVWNEFMTKRGWRDTDQPHEKFRDYKVKYGLGHRDDILTYFDFYDVDEGRKP
jgi:Domain of unknown function (DUF5069)